MGMDKQYAAAVILILVGLGLTQLEGGDGNQNFLYGMGVGTIVMAAVWIVAIIVRDLKRR